MEWFDEFRKARKDRGLSQEKLAPTFGVTARTIARWEKGKMRRPRLLELETLKKLPKRRKSLRGA
jgi:transcriptional regulator with XRE-family HTH domain